jgi:hypothetical protein
VVSGSEGAGGMFAMLVNQSKRGFINHLSKNLAEANVVPRPERKARQSNNAGADFS